MRVAIAICAVSAIAACGIAEADPNMAAYKEQVVNELPTRNGAAYSNTFYACGDSPSDRYEIECQVCDVSVHPIRDEAGGITGAKIRASHTRHDLKPWEEGGVARISRSGDIANERMETDTPDPASVRALFETANDWCTSRRKGEFTVRKDEIDTVFGGAE